MSKVIKVPDAVYEQLKEAAEERGCFIWRVIADGLGAVESKGEAVVLKGTCQHGKGAGALCYKCDGQFGVPSTK